MAAEPINLDNHPRVRRIDATLDQIEARVRAVAAENDELAARLGAAGLYARLAVASAQAALDQYDHRQRHRVHDAVVEALAHLRTLERILTPEPQEAPSQARIRRN
jgi:hypothetical protein